MLKIPDSVVVSRIDGEAVLLDMQGGMYYGLDPVGSRIWEVLAAGGGLEEAVRMLLNEYSVDEPTARKDAGTLIESLKASGLLLEQD